MKRSATLGICTLLLAFSPWHPAATAATDAEKQAAIRKGLAYLYKTQQPEGFWSASGYEHGTTGAAVFALLSQQDKWDSDAALYQTSVDKAISYLLNEAHVADVGARDDGVNVCPGGEASCKGIAWYDNGDSIYTTGFVAPAIAAYGLKRNSIAVATSTGPLAGMTWTQIAQGITNAYAAHQSASKNGRLGGAWLHAAPGARRPDRWTTQPAVISLLYNQLLGAVTPQIIKDELKGWLASVQDASGAVCYEKSSADQCEVVNVGEWLLAVTFAGYDVPDAQVDAVLASLNLTWPSNANNVWRGNFGHPYGMWTVYAGLDRVIGLNDGTHITNFLTDCGAATNERPTSLPGSAACSWAEDYNHWLVKGQKPDGSWAGYSYWTGPMAAALHVNILGGVDIPRGTYECPLRQAFWQGSRVAWPVDSLSIGSQAYSKNDLLATLGAPIGAGSSGDASLILIDELMTAKLNLARGSEKSPIASIIADADRLLSGFNGRLPYQVEPASPAGQRMAELANLLDQYNNGAMTPGCMSNDARNGTARNRQQPDRPTQQPTALVTESSIVGARASIDNSQKAQLASKKVRPPKKTKGVTSIDVSPDGTTLATASSDNSIRIFDFTTVQQILALPAAANLPTGLAFSPDGKKLNGVAGDSLVHVWDAVSGNELVKFTGHEAGLRSVAASSDSRFVASAGEETRILLWNAASNKLDKILYGSTDFLNALSFSPDSTLLASAGEDALVLLFEVASGKIRFTLLGHSDAINAVSFSPNGSTLASGGDDSVIHVWDAVKGVQRLALAGHEAPIRALAFNPNGQLLASGGEDAQIILWDTATGKISQTLTGSAGAVTALVFHPKGPFLISATVTGEISIWNIASGKRISIFTIPI
jgi:WD40 repeat protein